MKRKIKAMNQLALGGLALGALSSAGTSMGSNLVGNFSQGFGTMMSPIGTIYGTGMVIDSAKALHPHWKNKGSWNKRKKGYNEI